jgi:Fe-S cluster biogenesis protein NfuA
MPQKIKKTTATIDRIKAEIEIMRPLIQGDGGDVAFKSFDEATGVVEVELQGHCVGCPLSQITLKQGLEENIRASVPEVTEVISIS